MELIDIKILRGPNYWSNFRKQLIVLKIDLLDFEHKPSNAIKGFNNNLKNILPSLYNHHCSEKQKGGFFKRLDEGTWCGHIIEHVALELQWLAGSYCGFGRTRVTNTKGVYHVIFSYEYENVGLYAGRAAFNLVKHLALEEKYLSLEADLKKLRELIDVEKFGPSTQSIVDELNKREIPYQRLNKDSLLLIGQGKYQKLMLATETSCTSIVSVEMAADKKLTKDFLSANYIPVPVGIAITHEVEVVNVLNSLQFPLVVKPSKSNHGKGVSTNIRYKDAAVLAFFQAKQYSDSVIFEEFVEGDDYRFLLINYKVVAVAKREPAKVIGDGISTIANLIEKENEHPKRGQGHDNFLTRIDVDDSTLTILRRKNLNLDSILMKNEVLYLKYAANISMGGTAEDVTDLVHSENIFLVERVARLMHLDICGIDIISKNIAVPLTKNNGAIIEVNSSPGFRMHLSPSKGQKRNIAASVVDMLYPKAAPARIPVIAVTGTNGKTTVVRLIAEMAKVSGLIVGATTTDGVYIGDRQIYKGDCSGPLSAKVILNDPSINFAVLECARGGILRSGLGFDHCNVSIITNISEDHLGLNDIDTLEELARVKAVVPRSTFYHGYAILNADDALVYAIKNEVNCHIALFSMQVNNNYIHDFVTNGGLACYLDETNIILAENNNKIDLGNIIDMPLTFQAKATCMVKNILPAVLAAYVSGITIEMIKKVLLSFVPNSKFLPGRMNVYEIGGRTLILDYAHNTEAFLELKQFMSHVNAKKIGLIAATGDRRSTDIIRLGKHAAEIFDEIVIRHDRDGRGRTNKELTDLLICGIKSVSKNISVSVISDECRALEYILQSTKKGVFIFYFPDKVDTAILYLEQLINENNKKIEATKL